MIKVTLVILQLIQNAMCQYTHAVQSNIEALEITADPSVTYTFWMLNFATYTFEVPGDYSSDLNTADQKGSVTMPAEAGKIQGITVNFP